TTTLYNSVSRPITSTPFTLYVSLVPKASDFTDPLPPSTWPVTTPITVPPAVNCKPSASNGGTLDASDCILLKVDTLPKYSAGDYLSLKWAGPPGTLDSNTDNFTDTAYDTTVLVGNIDNSYPLKPSVQGLFEVQP